MSDQFVNIEHGIYNILCFKDRFFNIEKLLILYRSSIQIFKARKSIPAYRKKLLQIVVGQQKNNNVLYLIDFH